MRGGGAGLRALLSALRHTRPRYTSLPPRRRDPPKTITRDFGGGGAEGLPPTAERLSDAGGANVVLLGTIHFSKSSVEDVKQVARSLQPQVIMVELCRHRIGLLELNDEQFIRDAQNFDARKIRESMKGSDLLSGTLHAVLLKTYADMARELGVAPGAEFRQAYREMQSIPGCKLFLGDRPVQITIGRAVRSLTLFEMGRLVIHLVWGKSVPLSTEQLEKYKDKEFLNNQMKAMEREVPAYHKILTVLVEERDVCLAYSLQECVRSAAADGEGEGGRGRRNARVLGVVGAGHADGVRAFYGRVTRDQVVSLLSVPRPPLVRTLLAFTIKWGFIFLVFSFVYKLLKSLLS